MNSKFYNFRQRVSVLVLFFVLAIFNLHETCAQAPDWAWARSAGGIDAEFGQSVAADPSGSGYSYAAGWFYSDSITFGSTTLINAGETDGYVAKYDEAGNVLWAESIASAGRDEIFSVTVDASGNCYAGGYFNSPSITIGDTTFINAGNNDLLIVKYDQDGNVVWAKSAGGAHDDYAWSVTADGRNFL